MRLSKERRAGKGSDRLGQIVHEAAIAPGAGLAHQGANHGVVDAMTGQEADILQIIESDKGSLAI